MMPIALAMPCLALALAAQPTLPAESASDALRAAVESARAKRGAPASSLPASLPVSSENVPGAKLWTEGSPTMPRPSAAPDIAALAAAALPAVVAITVTSGPPGGRSNPFHDFLERASAEQAPAAQGTGTGFVIRSDGLVLTASHVIEGAADIEVRVGDQPQVFRARLVGRDGGTDLALLKIDAPGPFPVLALGDSGVTRVGEPVVAIGSPFGLSHTVTTGIISYKGRHDVLPSGRPGYYSFIQTDAAINPGNSGGPLLDGRGLVIGINDAVNPQGQGLAFAVPVDLAKTVLPDLAERGSVHRSYVGLGIQDEMSRDLAASFGVPERSGVPITRVVEGAAGERAGLLVGDVIHSFDGEPITEEWRLRWLVAVAPVGKTVGLEYFRDGKLRHTQVTLESRPGAPAQPAARSRRSEGGDQLGFAVSDANDAESPGKVTVDWVSEQGAAYLAGLRSGDVILRVDGVKLQDRHSFERALQRVQKPRVTRLLVERDGHPLFIGVRGSGQPARNASMVSSRPASRSRSPLVAAAEAPSATDSGSDEAHSQLAMKEGEYAVESLHVVASVGGTARVLDLSQTPSKVGKIDGGEHSLAERGVLTLAPNGVCELALAISVDGQPPGISERACSWSLQGKSLLLGAADDAQTRYTITKNDDNRYTLDRVVGSGGRGEPKGKANGERLILTRGSAAQASDADGEAPVRAEASTGEPAQDEI